MTRLLPTSLCLIISFLTLIQGEIPLEQAFNTLYPRLNSSEIWHPILDERLPRLIILFLAGASLAVSGAITQSLFQNPLAAPSTLGLCSGSSLFIFPIFALSLHINNPFLIPLSSFLGSFCTLLLVYSLAKYTGNSQISSLILCGIAISIVLSAIRNSLVYAFHNHWELIYTLSEWESASTLDLTWQNFHMLFPLSSIGLFLAWLYRKELDIISLGEENALSLGVDVPKVRWRLFLCTALLSGGAMASIGPIVFFAFLLPHLVRLIVGPKAEDLLPQSTLYGALSLASLDLTIRYLGMTYLSINSLSSLIGGVCFLYLLFFRKNSKELSLC